MADTDAFIIRGDDGESYGPVDLEELKEWVRENRAGIGTAVRRDEPGSLWQAWQFYPELVALLAEAQAQGGAPQLEAGALVPFSRRMAAFVIDYFLFSVIAGIGVAVVDSQFLHETLSPEAFLASNMGSVRIIFDVTVILYMAGCIAALGRTPGKSAFGLRVVDESGNKPPFGRALLRGLIYCLSLNLLGLPFLLAFFNPQRQTLHDLVAKTWVVVG